MASEFTDMPQFLATRTGEASQAQFSTSDYGRVGDQRPYQIVQPSYGAPKFLGQFSYLNDALRECGTLCSLQGQPFRLMKWGGRVPCYPCRVRKTTNQLPSLRVHSVGALDGFPELQPIADFRPNGGTIVYDSSGQPKVVGAPNFIVSRTPNPPTRWYDPKPLTQRYLEAVQTAQALAGATGKPAFICSSMGAGCGGNDKKYVPVVYVQPGGLAKRYPSGLKPTNSANGSITGTTPVTEDEFRELVRQSEGGTRLGQGA